MQGRRLCEGEFIEAMRLLSGVVNCMRSIVLATHDFCVQLSLDFSCEHYRSTVCLSVCVCVSSVGMYFSVQSMYNTAPSRRHVSFT